MRFEVEHDSRVAGELLGIHISDPAALGKLTRGIQNAVARSFVEDKNPTPTMHEVRRRGAICIEVSRELRGDLKWTVDRIVGVLSKALRAKLDGIPWNPEKERTIWTPPKDLVTNVR